MKTWNRRKALQAAGLFVASSAIGRTAASAPPGAGKKILIVVSSHDRKGEDLVAGFWFPELSHPAKVFAEAGHAFDIASPRGGLPPFDGFDLQDEASRWFWIQPRMRNQLANSLPLSRVDATRYAAVVLVGGHGPMWDFTGNTRLQSVVRAVYEQGGIVGAVCHGPAGLLDVRLSDGRLLIADRRLTGFTHEEEVSRRYDRLVPFDLESALRAGQAAFSEAPAFQNHVVVDGRLITGQNPASAKAFGEAVVAALPKRTG